MAIKRTQTNRLVRKQSFLVADFITKHYTESKKNDEQFAADVSTALQFGVSSSTIGSIRRDLGIASNAPQMARPEHRISQLEQGHAEARARIHELQEEFRKLGAAFYNKK